MIIVNAVVANTTLWHDIVRSTNATVSVIASPLPAKILAAVQEFNKEIGKVVVHTHTKLRLTRAVLNAITPFAFKFRIVVVIRLNVHVLTVHAADDEELTRLSECDEVNEHTRNILRSFDARRSILTLLVWDSHVMPFFTQIAQGRQNK